MSKEYKTHNDDPDIVNNGTSLKGYLTISYDRLVKLFGKPDCGDGYKVDAEWTIQFDDGTIATIYNWKNGPNYHGGNSYGGSDAVRKITEWNIGGLDRKAVDNLHKLVPDIPVTHFGMQPGIKFTSTRTVPALVAILICITTATVMMNYSSSSDPVSVEQYNEN